MRVDVLLIEDDGTIVYAVYATLDGREQYVGPVTIHVKELNYDA